MASGPIAQAFVEIRPQLTGFSSELQSGLEKAVGEASAGTSLTGLESDVSSAGAKIGSDLETAGATGEKALSDLESKGGASVEALGTKVDSVGGRARDAAGHFVSAGTTISSSMEGASSKGGAALKDLESKGGESADGLGTKFKSGIGGIISDLTGLSPEFAIATGGVVGIGVAVLAIGKQFQTAFNTLRSTTGDTGAQLTALEGSFKTVLGSVPDSMSKVASTISLVSVRSGLTGKALDSLTTTELDLARATGEELGPQVDDTTKAFANFGIKGAAPSQAALEALLAVSQRTGVGVDTLASSVVGKAGATFRSFGLDIGSSAAILGTLGAAGIAPTAVVMGLGKVVTAAAAQGVSATGALAALFNTLQSGTPGTAAYSAAVKELGARGFTTMSDAVKSGKLTIQDFQGTVQGVPGSISALAAANETLGEKFDDLRNKAMVAIQPIIAGATRLANVIVGDIPGAIDTVVAAIKPLVDAFSAAFSGGAVSGSGIVSVFSEIGSVIHSVVVTVAQDWDAFIAGFTGSGAEISAGAAPFVKFGNDVYLIFEAVSKAWKDFTAGFSGGDTSGLTGFAKILSQVGTAAHTVFDFLQANAKPILIALGIAFVALTSPITLIVGGLILLYNRFAVAREIMLIIAGLIKDVVIFAFKQLISYVTLVIGVFTDLIHFVTDIFQGRWGAAFNALLDIPKKLFAYLESTVKNIIGLFTGLPTQLLSALAALPGVLLGLFTSAMSGIGRGVVAGLAALGQLFVALPGEILGWLGDAGSWLVGVGVSILTGLFNDLVAGLTIVGKFFTGLAAKVLGWLGNTTGYLLGVGVKILTGFYNDLVTGLVVVTKFFVGLPAKILLWLGNTELYLIGVGVKILTGLFNDLVLGLSVISKFFLGLGAKVLGWVANAATWLVGVGVKVLTGLYNDFVKGLSVIQGFFTALPAKIISFLGDVGSWLINAGGQIIDGLLQGIRNAEHKVTDELGNLAGKVKKAITNPLSILSPSGVFAEYGMQLMAGLAQGISQNANLPTAALAKIAAGLTVPNKVPIGQSLLSQSSVNGASGNQYNLTITGVPMTAVTPQSVQSAFHTMELLSNIA